MFKPVGFDNPAVIVALIFGMLAKLSGGQEEAMYLSMNIQNITFNFRDLLFAGILVSALGACMDVGMSIASSLDELKNKTKDMDWIDLFKSGMNIGKDIIGTMANTLILAYVGGSLTLILLFMACDFNFVQILNKETIAQEIISAIAGSMGVVYTVPITSFVYAVLNKDQVNYHMLKDTIMYLGRNLEDDFSSPLDTFGFLAYKNYGFLGARGEVIRGLPNAFKAIKVLDEYECYDNEALTMALIEIIRGLEDTVLLKRSGSLEKYNYYKNLVGSIDNYDITKIEEITEECISENISFGGSADILAISIFIKKMLERLVFYERQ